MIALQEVDPQRRAGCAQDVIRRAQVDHHRQHRRPAALTAREALAVIQFECLIIWMAAGNLRSGAGLTEEDFARVTLAQKRIDAIAQEVG